VAPASTGSPLGTNRESWPAHPRVLLLDCLDALGADIADARDRASLLRAAGARVTALAVGRNLDPLAKGLGRDAMVVEPGAPALDAARRLADAARFDVAIVASSERGGGTIARALPASLPARWWPTGLSAPGSGGWLARWVRSIQGPGLPALFPVSAGAARSIPALAGCWVEPPTTRRATLPLWDGEIVLAPEGLGERSGATVLSAFASLAEEWSELDLVSWSHPRATDEVRAHRVGAGCRVHHVGPPPRMAEWAWWLQARAVVWTGRTALAGGLVLRALSAGCPLLFVGQGADSPLAEALHEEGCAWLGNGDPRGTAGALSRILERGPEVEAAIERGRVVAAHHDRTALASRLASGLSIRPAREAAAA
jgi:hypothetical protein